MAVRINSGVSAFRVGTEGGGECGPWEWPPNSGRLFMVGFNDSTGTIQIWYSEDDGATWSEADSAGRPSGLPNSYSVGVAGCQVDGTLYVAYPYGNPTGTSYVAAALSAFDMDSLLWGRDMRDDATTPHLEPNFDWYDCNNGIVPLPGERLRLLHLNDTLGLPGVPPLEYGVRFSDLDLTTGVWGAQTIVDDTPDGVAFPSSIVAGAGGRTHIFYKDDTSGGSGGQRGMHRTVNEDGSMEAEQVLIASPDFAWVDKYGFGQAHSVYDPVSGKVKLAVPYHGVRVTSPANHSRIGIMVADSEAEPSWTAVELGTDPVYDGFGAGESADGNVLAGCFYGHLRAFHAVLCGQTLASLPRTANSEVDMHRYRYLGGAASSALVHDPGGTLYVSGVHVRPITGGLGIIFSVNGTQAWFEKVPLDFCTG